MSQSQRQAKESFRTKLSSYAVGVRGQLAKPGESGGAKKWLLYSAAAGASVAAAVSTDAAIIYSGVRNVTVGLGLNSSAFVTVANAAATATATSNISARQFFIHALQTSGHYRQSNWAQGRMQIYGNSPPSNGPLLAVYPWTNGTFFAKNFGAGQVISSLAGPFYSRGVVAQGRLSVFRNPPYNGTFTSRQGAFPTSANGFAGFQFRFPGSPDDTHYGWIRLHVGDSDNNGVPDRLTVVDWAYESTPGAPIRAGAIPEPSTLALASLAMGCAGLAALRRRRQLQKTGERGA